MKINCMLDKKTFENKPKSYETGGIQKRLIQTEIEIEELAEKLGNGATFKPAFLGGTKSNSWINQQIFALDFDGGTTIQDELDNCNELNILPVFGYKTFSYKEEKHKFRLVFCNDIIITDVNIRNKFQKLLIALFPNSDSVTFDPTRLFYGGISLINCDYNNRINIEDIMNKFNHLNINEINSNNNKESEVCTTNIKEDNKYIFNNNSSTNLNPNNPNNPINKQYISRLKLIIQRKSEELKSIINHPHIIFSTDKEFFDYIKRIDLLELFGLKYHIFKCFLHKDNNPSASIIKNEQSGEWFYKCYSSNCKYKGKWLNIITLIESLCNFQRRQHTLKFIKEIFNLEITETEYQKEIKKEYDGMLRNLIHVKEFDEYCPQTAKNIRYVRDIFMEIITIAKDNVYSEKYQDNNGNPIFFMYREQLSNQLISSHVRNTKMDNTTIGNKIILLQYHKLLTKLDDANIPEELLKKSQGYSIYCNDGFARHVNWFTINPLVVNSYFGIEEQGMKWRNFGYTMKGMSRTMFYKNEGEDVANWLYPQHKLTLNKNTGEIDKRTISKADQERLIFLVAQINDLLDSKNYCLEKDLIRLLCNELEMKEENAKKQLKKLLPSIISDNNLIKITANKEIKDKYNINKVLINNYNIRIPERSYPKIIVKGGE